MTGEMRTAERATPGHTTLPIGSLRMRLPVAAKIALHTARYDDGGVQLQMQRVNHVQPKAQPERISQLATAVRSAANCAEENPGANPGCFASGGRMA